MRTRFILLFVLSGFASQGQSDKPRLITKKVAVSLLPGMGTFGILPGAYQSDFSLNLLSGYSYSSRILEISLISAANVSETRGIQLSGIGNITGINYSLSPFTEMPGEANLSGIQVAGALNWVRDYVHGAQFASVYNRTRNLMGVQMGGMNRVSGFGIGNQTGIYNWTQGSFDGAQLGALMNEAGGRLVGLQLAPVNIAGSIEGRNSDPDKKYTALQLGLVNISGDMHGFQLGLINIGGKMRGTQIGIINISSSANIPVNKRNGTTVGLLNIGSFHSAGIYVGELFLYNFYFETGTMKNGAIRGQRTNRYFTSSVEYSFSSLISPAYERQFGLGFHKYYYNRTLTPGMNEKRYARGSLGLNYLQTKGEKFSMSNFYTGAGAGAGYRIINKIGLYLTAHAAMNYAWDVMDLTELPFGSIRAGSGLLWPAWRIGLAVH